MANRWAPSILARAFAGGVTGDNIVLSADVLKLALMATAYTPGADLTGVAVYSDISASEAAGAGYLATGITVPTPAMSTIYAATFGRVWSATQTWALGDVVRPLTAPTHLFACVKAGLASGAEPAWPPVSGADITEGANVTWSEIGTSLTKFSSANIVSPSMSLTGIQYGWIYDNSTTNKDLICLLDFGSQKNWTSTVVTFTPDANLGWVYLTPS